MRRRWRSAPPRPATGLSRAGAAAGSLRLTNHPPPAIRATFPGRLGLPFQEEIEMSRICELTGKGRLVGNNVSHANNKTKRRFLPNLQRRRFWVESENRWVSLRLTNAALRTIDKRGIDVVLAELRSRGEHV